MKDNDKKIVFIIQLSEGILKIVKCLRHNNSHAEFIAVNFQPLPSEKELAAALNKLGLKSNEIVAVLPRSQATCRFLKIPSINPQEIEKISRLQASRYLPYPADELVTAYQILRTDKDGFSDIILTIAHKNSIAGYLNILIDIPKYANLSIILSSYGICNLYYRLEAKESGTVMLIDIDGQQAELVVTNNKKMLFSRSFKVDKETSGWEEYLCAEIVKTLDAFIKEVPGEAIKKIIILGVKTLPSESMLRIKQKAGLPVEYLNYAQSLSLRAGELTTILGSEHSFASLIGFGLENHPDSLNILPEGIKETNLNARRRREQLKIAILISGIALAWFLGITKNLDNKHRYLGRLKAELSEVSREAQPLEGIEKRFKLIERNSGRKDSPLDILYELHLIIPEQVNLISLTYEENKSVVLRGTSTGLNTVFSLVSALEKSPVFAKFNIKIRYATSKKTQNAEIIDFEIGCAR